METLRRFLREQAQKYGRPILLLYAFVFLLMMTFALILVYLFVGWLTVQSPYGVLAVTGVLVVLIFYFQFRKKP